MGLWKIVRVGFSLLSCCRAVPVALVDVEYLAPLRVQLTTQWELVQYDNATAAERAAAVAIVPGMHEIVGSKMQVISDDVPQVQLLQVPLTGTDLLNWTNIPKHWTVADVHQAGKSIPEYVLAAVLSWNVRLPQMDADFRRCTWNSEPPGNTCRRPAPHRTTSGQTIGILGYGTIGSGVGTRAAALGMRVVVMTHPLPAQKPPEVAWWGGPEILAKLLQESDFVVVCLPLLASTTNLLNASMISQMKPSAVLINIARAGIVNESALYTALLDHKIAGAVIDVWWHEFVWMRSKNSWPSQYNFSALDNVWMTPHASCETAESQNESYTQVSENLDLFAKGLPLNNIVQHPQDFPTMSLLV